MGPPGRAGEPWIILKAAPKRSPQWVTLDPNRAATVRERSFQPRERKNRLPTRAALFKLTHHPQPGRRCRLERLVRNSPRPEESELHERLMGLTARPSRKGDRIVASRTKILAFAGSAREGSYNKKLVRVAAEAVRAAGADVTVLDFRDLPLPMFDEDVETRDGAPENARRFKTMLIEHHGIIVASPEYNSSISPLLKNAIDWASRPASGEAPLVAFRGKVAALLAASPGALGGLRGLVTVRSILSNIGVIVLPDQVAIPKAHEAFDEAGALKDARQQASVQALAGALVGVCGKLLA